MTQENYERAESIQRQIRKKKYHLNSLNGTEVYFLCSNTTINDELAELIGKDLFTLEIEKFKDAIKANLQSQIDELKAEFEKL